MKKSLSFFLLMAIVFIGACANLDKPKQEGSDIESMLKDFDAAFVSRDLDRIISFFAEDCVYDDVNAGSLKHGRVEMEANLKEGFDAFPDVKITIKTQIISGNMVAIQWAMTGTHTGPLRRLPATGRYISIPVASFMEIQEGKIKRLSHYYNMIGLLRQLGVRMVPQPE